MVLAVNGILLEKSPCDSGILYLEHPTLKDLARNFISIPAKIVGPKGLLYVCQKEMAVTISYDKNITILGSDDATTCIIVIIKHTGSGAIGIAHLDGSDTEECITTMVRKIEELTMGYANGQLEVHMVGGYSDPNNISARVFNSVILTFINLPSKVELKTICVGECNTTIRNNIPWPILYGVGFDLRSGEIFPATFSDKGPEIPLRTARQLFSAQRVLDVYDCNLGMIKIGPFSYEPLRGADLWLKQSDEFILKQMSTTPDTEPPYFATQIKSAFNFVREHPFPDVTVFKDNQPLYFKRDEDSCLWIPFN